ncbi:MAG: tyrosine-type recombinase/integrase [Acidimicrobiales bacterium]
MRLLDHVPHFISGVYLQPGWDWLVARKLSSFWREVAGSPIEADMARFLSAAETIGFTPIQAYRAESQSVGRALLQTGHVLDDLRVSDLDELADACRRRSAATGKDWGHYRSAINTAHRVLFHLGVVELPPPSSLAPRSLEDRMAGAPDGVRCRFIDYLERKTGTCRPKTVSSLATRLSHFGRFLADIDPELSSLSALERCRHIEPYLNSVAHALSTKTGEAITTADQSRRILAVSNFLRDISDWGWPDAPPRRLVFPADLPRLPRPLPRYLPVDADRRLTEALAASDHRLAADALLLARACGLRIGELLDLEVDCVHEIPAHGSWLKVPLGKLDTERMVPLDDETVALLDRIIATRTPGRPLPHPRTGRPAEFLFTHHGRRLSQGALRAELSRAAASAGIDHVTPHALRHTYAHRPYQRRRVPAGAHGASRPRVCRDEPALRPRVRQHRARRIRERALDLAKTRLGPMPSGRTRIPVTNGEWRDAPAIKARLAGGYCLRAPAQGACPYANICEHCPSFRTDAASKAVLAAQRIDAEALAADAVTRGWGDEADRHRRLIARLDALIAEADTA